MASSSWGAIFDFDGVIVNSESYHERCWRAVASDRNQKMTREQFLLGFGVKNARFISEILGWTEDALEIEEISRKKEALYQEIARTVPLVEGLLPFLKELKRRNIQTVIASSSILKNIEISLRELQLESYFSFIVSSEDVSSGKPHPEVFLKAADKLKMAPSRCLVFEDALYGIEAADRAGCRKVALTTAFAANRFETLGFSLDKIIHSFNEITIDEIDRWFA